MKKILSIILIMVMCLAAVSTTACSPLDSEEEADIKSDVYGIYDQFRTAWKDAGEISEYAVSARNWAVGTGLMNGKSATTVNPKDNATRAEIAAITRRFIENNK